MSSLSLLQGIFPTQGSNPGLLHFRQILYCLRHQGSSQKTGWDISKQADLHGALFPFQKNLQHSNGMGLSKLLHILVVNGRDAYQLDSEELKIVAKPSKIVNKTVLYT